MTLQFKEIKTSDNPVRAVIGIHGWKGNKSSFLPIVKSAKLPDTHWFLPEAPYDVDLSPNEKSWSFEITPGNWEVDEPTQLLHSFIKDKVLRHYNPKNVYVMGFSQGALVCFEFILKLDIIFGGVFPVAGFMRDPKANEVKIHPDQLNTPILIGHGKKDNTVPAKASELAYEVLKEQKANVDLFLFNGGHKMDLQFIRRFRESILK